MNTKKTEKDKLIKEQIEKINTLETEKGAVTKLIADQAITIREKDAKLKDFEEQVNSLREERQEFIKIKEEADYLRRFKAEQVPLLEERAKEAEIKAENYHKTLAKVFEDVKNAMPVDSHFV